MTDMEMGDLHTNERAEIEPGSMVVHRTGGPVMLVTEMVPAEDPNDGTIYAAVEWLDREGHPIEWQVDIVRLVRVA